MLPPIIIEHIKRREEEERRAGSSRSFSSRCRSPVRRAPVRRPTTTTRSAAWSSSISRERVSAPFAARAVCQRFAGGSCPSREQPLWPARASSYTDAVKHGRIGRFELLHKIAAGGMAEIFLARQWGQGGFFRDVVIKRLFPHYAEHEHALRMFQDEARLLAELSHPNIPQVYDLGYADGYWYLAMEYVRGVSLADLCRAAAKRQQADAAGRRDRHRAPGLHGAAPRARAPRSRGTSAAHRSPRRHAAQHHAVARRRGEGARLRRRADHRAHGHGCRRRCAERTRTWGRSRCAANRSTSAPTCSRSA